MAEPALKRLTVGDFLAWDDGNDRRYELVAGEIVAMAPVGGPHSVIIGNFAGAAYSQLRPPCRVCVGCGIFLPDRNDAYYEADAAISCTPTRPGLFGAIDPIVIFEVLSPSTNNHDRGTKLPDYREIPSVHEIVLISAQEVRAELWRRSPEGWMVADMRFGQSLSLDSVGVAFPLESLYDGIDFPAAP